VVGKKYKVAVVGLGIGQQHLRHWQKLTDRFEIALVCDTESSRLNKATQRLGCDGVSDFAAVLQAGVDVIDICTPPQLHFEMAKQSLLTGHHTVCEKPLVSSLQECDALIDLQARSDQLLMPISQYRFAPGVQRLKYLLDVGLTGEPYLSSIETHWHRDASYYSEPWRGRWATEGGGVVLIHALHIHDLLCYLLGDVDSVYARLATRVNPIETEDCAIVSMTMKNGALVGSSATLGSIAQHSRLRFCFQQLTAESSLEPYNPGSDPWTFTALDSATRARVDEALSEFKPTAESFAGQFSALYDAIENDTQLPVTLADARRSLELVTAIYASASSGQAERLPIGKDHPAYPDWRPSHDN